MKRPLRLAAVLASVTVAISGCATGGFPTFPGLGEDAGYQPQFQDVSMTGEIYLDTARDQYNVVPVPGVKISRHRLSEPGGASCTLGPAVSDGVRTGFVTAGHCDDGDDGTLQYAQIGAVADSRDSRLRLGPIEDGQVTAIGAQDGKIDSGAIWAAADPAVTTLAGTWPIIGVATVEAVRQLPPGAPVCANGAETGVRCPPLLDADNGRIRFDGPVVAGDAGAPLFVVDQFGDATLIGIVAGYDPNDSTIGEATFLEPVLARLDALALVDRDAATKVVGDSRFSDRVTMFRG